MMDLWREHYSILYKAINDGARTGCRELGQRYSDDEISFQTIRALVALVCFLAREDAMREADLHALIGNEW